MVEAVDFSNYTTTVRRQRRICKEKRMRGMAESIQRSRKNKQKDSNGSQPPTLSVVFYVYVLSFSTTFLLFRFTLSLFHLAPFRAHSLFQLISTYYSQLGSRSRETANTPESFSFIPTPIATTRHLILHYFTPPSVASTLGLTFVSLSFFSHYTLPTHLL